MTKQNDRLHVSICQGGRFLSVSRSREAPVAYGVAVRRARSPRAEATATTRAVLVEAATRLFAERGFAATSLDDVAAAAGMTKGAVYHHFANKAAVFEAAFEAQEQQVHARLRDARAAAPDPVTASRTTLAVFLDACMEPVYGPIVFRDGPIALGWERWQECEVDYGLSFVAQVLADLEAAGHLARPVGASLPALVLGMLSSAGQLLGRTPPEEHPALRAELLETFDQFLAGLAVSPG